MDVARRTRLLILQPTPFCNIDCGYCYLPARNDRRRMAFETVEAAVRFVFEAELAAPDFTVVWHGGEPMVLPIDWFRKAFRAASRGAPGGVVLTHAIQTNGTLIDDDWCSFFRDAPVRVGVSLDGPAWLHDARRRTRAGGGTHARVMRGIERLRRHGVSFHIICVVGEPALDAADVLMDFFEAEDIRSLAFNIEEIEGVNRASTLARAGVEERFRRFFVRVLERAAGAPAPLIVREQQDLLASLAHPAFGQLSYNTTTEPFGFLTVSAEGDLYTFSPELAGLRDPHYGDFALGRVGEAGAAEILRGERFRRLWADITEGVAICRRSCAYFDLCLGGSPANKLAEHGHLARGETLFCRLAHQGVADAVLGDLERRLQQNSDPAALSALVRDVKASASHG
ncbi:Anaerobic sulfatase-maturating enzyme [Methylobacterium bullatum]|uniref:Anaerobic sulfatase-maturating enzyme n=1 Tax=Methylobacterium bullatum TaxID=570505 RepID=A0A679J326_9HYPH|nr:Anaerobic sulfatase-maturating enzyme [Methylobacterium bullatum]